MKKLFIASLLCCAFSLQSSAQDIFDEVKNIMDNYETIKNDESQSLDVRKIATFKWDAIYYMLSMATDETESELGTQVDAMIDFVNLFFSKLKESKSSQSRQVVMSKFKNATLENARFNDTDKEIIYAYVDNQDF